MPSCIRNEISFSWYLLRSSALRFETAVEKYPLVVRSADQGGLGIAMSLSNDVLEATLAQPEDINEDASRTIRSLTSRLECMVESNRLANKRDRTNGIERRCTPVLIAIACVFLPGCNRTPSLTEPTPPAAVDSPAILMFTYGHRTPSLSLTTNVGIWMHSGQAFDGATIADWLDVPYDGRRLLEPINVLWLDSAAQREDQATGNLVDFLDDCGFRREGDVFFGQVPRHSSGYYASYGTGVWKRQYDPDDAWVQGFLGGQFANNHGRIFPSFPALSSAGQPVWVTSGAFSREGPAGNPFFFGVECLLKRENCHPYRSFDQARDELNCGATGWRVSGLVDFRNRYPVSAGLSFSTGDHSGVLVFERSS